MNFDVTAYALVGDDVTSNVPSKAPEQATH
jgi:hypothetical protein